MVPPKLVEAPSQELETRSSQVSPLYLYRVDSGERGRVKRRRVGTDMYFLCHAVSVVLINVEAGRRVSEELTVTSTRDKIVKSSNTNLYKHLGCFILVV